MIFNVGFLTYQWALDFQLKNNYYQGSFVNQFAYIVKSQMLINKSRNQL